VTAAHDLIVIGGGSGGLAHAQRASEYGASAAVVEYGPLGGTCVNVGCVPKKVMWYASQHAHFHQHAADYGFDFTVNGHDWAKLKENRDAYIARLNDIYASNLERRDVALIRGRARFVDEHTVDVDGKRYSAERFVIATGGYPIVPDVPGAEHGFTSDGFFELEARPQRVAIVGSGYVSVELSGVFSALGSETTLLVRRDGVLRSFDPMVGRELRSAMESGGILFETGVVPERLSKTAAGLTLAATDGRKFGPFDGVLWAVGRSPHTEGLGLEAAGVATDPSGFIPVDDFQRTNVEHISAIGDVTGRVALTPVANRRRQAPRRSPVRGHGRALPGLPVGPDCDLLPSADRHHRNDGGGSARRIRRRRPRVRVTFYADVLCAGREKREILDEARDCRR
jgi:glutathione reductase (NADPH)